MRDVEPQGRAQGILLVFGAEHALRHVAATPRLRARIPSQPPLHAQIHKERQQRQGPDGTGGPSQMEVGQEGNGVRGLRSRLANVVLDHLQLHLQRMHAADLGDGHPGQHHDHGHLERKLK